LSENSLPIPVRRLLLAQWICVDERFEETKSPLTRSNFGKERLMEIIKTNGVDIRSWCSDPEEQTIEQTKIIAELPYVREVCLMPDGHLGQNMCIGGVVATENVVVPDFCGVDVGCGMCVLKTNLTETDLTESVCQILFNMISERLPVGFAHNTDKRRKTLINQYEQKLDFIIQESRIETTHGTMDHNPVGDYRKGFFDQLGTLGSGNHFLEVQVDESGNVWVMIHSGSRNIGKKIGDYFNNVAQDLNAKWFSEARTIPFLPTDTPEGKAYLAWMDFALRFAFLNRKVMLDDVKDVFSKVFHQVKWTTQQVVDDCVGDMINIHHNFAAIENHHGKNVWVHRKGATKAFSGMTGIIPGSMGSSSYIVQGLGNHLSLMSCSHGAGRKMGRMQFNRTMKDSFAQIEDSLKGVLHTDFGEVNRGKDKGLKDVSEAPGAYKNIDEVISQELDLIKVLVKLNPRISIKG
jgi:tRNA-splicing ligase RtcB (3'-phosphate/5'-hydroxy nucleic acid ligase)